MITEKKETSITLETVERQHDYVEAQKKKGQGLGVVFADAFLRGMRDIGYKNPAWALSELSDNSFQAQANVFSIRFKPTEKDLNKPEQIAVIDDGIGMIPPMISYAVRWGGTDREGDRRGYGRYGYGLPSSSVSVAKRYTVYSKVKNEDWSSVTIDLNELASVAGDIEATEKLLEAKPAELPDWLIREEDKFLISELESGTIIVLEIPDRLQRLNGWKTIKTIKSKLLEHFGVIYRHKLPSEYRILVDGVLTEAVDPLFLMEHGRLYNETSVLAEKVETRTLEVETGRGTKGRITIRASVLPPHFQLEDPSQYGVKGAKNNKRFEVMKDYQGFLVCREWRQIDTISPWWTKFQNYDLNTKVEINFDAELDEFFGITTSKQQIVIEDAMRDKLRASGRDAGDLENLVEDIRSRFKTLQKELKAKIHNKKNEEPLPSSLAMQNSEKFKGPSPKPTQEQDDEAQRNLENAAKEWSLITGETIEESLKKITDLTEKKPWDIQFHLIPEGPFFRPFRLGVQKVVIINTDHPFYSKLYESAPLETRSALQVMLYVLAERELESKDEALAFYRAERQKWSERLRHALDNLVTDEELVDEHNAVIERLNVSLAQA